MLTKKRKPSASIIKRGKTYYVRAFIGYDENNKPIRPSLGTFKTRKEAEKVKNDFLETPFDIEVDRMMLSDLYRLFIKSKKDIVSKRTFESYDWKFSFCKSIENEFIKDIKAPHLQNLMNNINLSSGTKREIKSFFKMLFEFAVEMEYIPNNKANYIKIGKHVPVKHKETFTLEEIKTLWEHQDVYIAKVILVMIYTGYRIGEIIQMKKENVDFVNRVIRNVGNKTLKGKNRVVPIHNDIFDLLREMIKFSKNDYVVYIKFRPTFKEIQSPTTDQTVRRNFNEFMEKLGMNHTPHDTRGTLATLLSKQGTNETVITDIMGHANFKTTQDYYIQNDIETIKESIDKIKILN